MSLGWGGVELFNDCSSLCPCKNLRSFLVVNDLFDWNSLWEAAEQGGGWTGILKPAVLLFHGKRFIPGCWAHARQERSPARAGLLRERRAWEPALAEGHPWPRSKLDKPCGPALVH